MMLVFKDTTIGFVAGIQLAANKMVSVGDWIELPKYRQITKVYSPTFLTI